MAHEQQVELLKQGPEAWNAWRAEQPEATVVLSDGALRGLDLTGANLSGANLSGADLCGVDLRGAVLDGANLFKAILDGADLRNSDLSGVRFVHCAQLQAAQNWQTAYRDEDLACGATTPTR